VIAYIGTLPDTPATPTVVGDAVRGRELYTTCAACHGNAGQGIWSSNAPRLAGMNDWYLMTQINNFRSAIRGSHPQDLYGEQMIRMSSFLSDEQAVSDLIAYINTL
jgi:cytochrome c oxidase subunit II